MWDADSNNEHILKPCPFCGGHAHEHEDNDMETIIECTTCEASIYRHNGKGEDYVKRARIAWNRRTS